MAIDIVRLTLQRLHAASARGGGGEAVNVAAVHQALAIPDLVHLLRQQRMGMVQVQRRCGS